MITEQLSLSRKVKGNARRLLFFLPRAVFAASSRDIPPLNPDEEKLELRDIAAINAIGVEPAHTSPLRRG